MAYKYEGNDEITFTVQNRSEKNYFRKQDKVITLATPGLDFKNQNLSFAIDFSPNDRGFFDWSWDGCREKSSPNLRYLIVKCHHKTAIRELTEEEKRKLEDYKAHQKGKGLFSSVASKEHVSLQCLTG